MKNEIISSSFPQEMFNGSGRFPGKFYGQPKVADRKSSQLYMCGPSLLLDFGNYLEQNGEVVKSVNLCDMRQSCQYNPFAYTRTQQDLQKLIANIIANTTPPESHSQDPFWEKSETLFLTAIFNYVWLECPRDEIIRHDGEYGADEGT